MESFSILVFLKCMLFNDGRWRNWLYFARASSYPVILPISARQSRGVGLAIQISPVSSSRWRPVLRYPMGIVADKIGIGLFFLPEIDFSALMNGRNP